MTAETVAVDNRSTSPIPSRNEDVVMTAETAAVPVTPAKQTHVFSPELLSMYYSRLFPFEFMYQWLSYDPLGKNPQTFSRREFSFTLEPSPGDEIYIRYQSYSSEDELKAAIMKRQPRKIDIGAVFNHAPKDKNATPNFSTVQRELVFDIDLTDYDDIRHCGCSGANICGKCWTFMTMAVKLMDKGLRDDFGFEHIAWFYSGRRGVHAWVCDESARMLSNEGRSAVANYFEVSLNKKKNEGLPPVLHPMLQRAHEILEPMFIESVLPETGHSLLASDDQEQSLLESLPDAAQSVRKNLQDKWSTASGRRLSPEEKWHELKQHLRVMYGKENGKKKSKSVSTEDSDRIEMWPIETVFKYTYPRLDINVSKMQNHLLKSPFCVHPKTGRVCVPIQVEEVDSFDPFAVPTLPQLMQELDDFDGKAPKRDWQKTSLKAYFEPFQTKFLEPMLKELRRKARDDAEVQAAVVGDF
eukprot:Nitzschia sp. Nitz4//scaffold9_size221794//59097//60577//NITZ4_001334-RA/size221794-snap-gene-0.94-mRNA-1//1//CDS//3329560965//1497//frame0